MAVTEVGFVERVQLLKLAKELRESGLVGMIEIRNLFSELFPVFAEVRDSDIDDLLRRLAQADQPEQANPDGSA